MRKTIYELHDRWSDSILFEADEHGGTEVSIYNDNDGKIYGYTLTQNEVVELIEKLLVEFCGLTYTR